MTETTTEGEPREADSNADLARRLPRAIDKARRVLLRAQNALGAFDERSDIGPISTANVLVALHHAGLLPQRDLLAAARYLRHVQADDGSFFASPFVREGDPGATACVMAALHLTLNALSEPEERAANAAAFERAQAFLSEHGGIDGCVARIGEGDLSAIYLALVGLLEPSRLPSPSLLFTLSEQAVDFLATRFHFGMLMGAIELSLIAQDLGGAFGPQGRSPSWIDKKIRKRSIALLTRFQNPDGSWNSNTVQTAIAIPALMAAGLSPSDDRVARAASWLKTRKVLQGERLYFDVFGSDVWSTSFSLRALLLSGMSRRDERAESAARFLLESQLTEPQPRVNNRRPGAVLTGGFPFQTGNVTMADCDDAGIVLSALALMRSEGDDGQEAEPKLLQEITACYQRAHTWLAGMQNEDGGFSAFVWNLPGKRPVGRLFEKPISLDPADPWALLQALREPPPELGDPSTEDLTARVLHGLGSFDLDTRDPEIAEAIAFLRRQQTEFGGFWGRWVCNYLASTAYVLSALAEVREDLGEAYVRRAIDFVLAHQNRDGGFGESTESYLDPSKAGVGESTPPLTALIVGALVEVGEGDRPEVRGAVRYLLDKQRSDGTWPNEHYVATNIPPNGFYTYTGAVRHLPLEALARYRRRHQEAPEEAAQTRSRWSTQELSRLRMQADPKVDSLIEELYAEQDVGVISSWLATLLENDDPIPEALPEPLKQYFEATEALPQWADSARIARAQHLFEDFGLYVTFGFFCSSLPQSYAAANGAPVLTQTGAMLNRVRQRVFETAQFLFDVLDKDSFGPEGRGVRTPQRIRLMHGALRHLILRREQPAWDTEKLGLPINQEDLLGTLMTFSIVTFEACQRLGVALTEQDGDDWVHLWNVVGVLLGIDEALLPRSLEEAADLMEAIREHQWAPSADGRALTESLIDMMQEFFTQGAPALDGLSPTLIRYLAGDHCADLLSVAPSDWTLPLVGLFRDLTDLIDDDDRDSFLEHQLGRLVSGAMRWVTTFERDHKNATFRIPESLKDTVIAGT